MDGQKIQAFKKYSSTHSLGMGSKIVRSPNVGQKPQTVSELRLSVETSKSPVARQNRRWRSKSENWTYSGDMNFHINTRDDVTRSSQASPKTECAMSEGVNGECADAVTAEKSEVEKFDQLLRKQYNEDNLDVGNLLKSLSQSRGSRQKIVRNNKTAHSSGTPPNEDATNNHSSTTAGDASVPRSKMMRGTDANQVQQGSEADRSAAPVENISFFALSNELSELANSKEKKEGQWRKDLLSLKLGDGEHADREPSAETKNIIGKRRASMRSLGSPKANKTMPATASKPKLGSRRECNNNSSKDPRSQDSSDSSSLASNVGDEAPIVASTPHQQQLQASATANATWSMVSSSDSLANNHSNSSSSGAGWNTCDTTARKQSREATTDVNSPANAVLSSGSGNLKSPRSPRTPNTSISPREGLVVGKKNANKRLSSHRGFAATGTDEEPKSEGPVTLPIKIANNASPQQQPSTSALRSPRFYAQSDAGLGQSPTSPKPRLLASSEMPKSASKTESVSASESEASTTTASVPEPDISPSKDSATAPLQPPPRPKERPNLVDRRGTQSLADLKFQLRSEDIKSSNPDSLLSPTKKKKSSMFFGKKPSFTSSSALDASSASPGFASSASASASNDAFVVPKYQDRASHVFASSSSASSVSESSVSSARGEKRGALGNNPLSDFIELSSPVDTKAAFEWLRSELGLKLEPDQKMTVVTKPGLAILCLEEMPNMECALRLILLHRHWFSSKELLQQMRQLYRRNVPDNFSKILMARILRFVVEWLENSKSDFYEGSAEFEEIEFALTDLMKVLFEKKEDKLYIDWGFYILARIAAVNSNDTLEIVVDLDHNAPLKPGKKQIEFSDISIGSLAEQFCLLDQQLNQKIHEELLQKKYAKPETCPTITKLALHWNAITLWCATEIVNSPPKNTPKVIAKFIRLAEKLQSYSNWNSLMALYVGLNRNCVTKLTAAWEEVDKQSLESWNKLCDLATPIGNFKLFRPVHDSPTLPAILSPLIYVKDVTMLDEGNKDRVGELINYEKYEMLGNLLLRLYRTTVVSYSFTLKENLQTYLKSLNYLEESKLNLIATKRVKL